MAADLLALKQLDVTHAAALSKATLTSPLISLGNNESLSASSVFLCLEIAICLSSNGVICSDIAFSSSGDGTLTIAASKSPRLICPIVVA